MAGNQPPETPVLMQNRDGESRLKAGGIVSDALTGGGLRVMLRPNRKTYLDMAEKERTTSWKKT